MLVHHKRRDVDDAGIPPDQLLWLISPLPLVTVPDLRTRVPMQVVAFTFEDEQHLFRGVPVLARSAAWLDGLYVDIDRMLAQSHALLTEVLQLSLRRILPRLVFGAKHLQQLLVLFEETPGLCEPTPVVVRLRGAQIEPVFLPKRHLATILSSSAFHVFQPVWSGCDWIGLEPTAYRRSTTSMRSPGPVQCTRSRRLASRTLRSQVPA